MQNPQQFVDGIKNVSQMAGLMNNIPAPNYSIFYSFFHSLKIYFVVDHNYVSRKLLLVVWPWQHKSWARCPATDDDLSGSTGSSGFPSPAFAADDALAAPSSFGNSNPSNANSAPRRARWSPPAQDLNAPDLYVPLMALCSYALLAGLLSGLGARDSVNGNGTNKNGNGFSPAQLLDAVWGSLAFHAFEAALLYLALYLAQIGSNDGNNGNNGGYGGNSGGGGDSGVVFLDVVSLTGYKYAALCLNSLARALAGLLGARWLALPAAAYLSLALAVFVMKSLRAVLRARNAPVNVGGIVVPSFYILLACGAAQFVLTLILCFL